MKNTALRAVRPSAERLTQETILERIQAYVDAGAYPLMAAERVTREICAEGRQDELLVLFWPPPLFELWQGTRRERSEREPGTARPTAQSASKPARTRGEVLRQSSSLLESLVEIDGEWRRLGDLDRAACLKAAAIQKRKALARAQKARFYHAVAQRLADGQKVQDALGEDALAQMLTEAAR